MNAAQNYVTTNTFQTEVLDTIAGVVDDHETRITRLETKVG